MSRPFPNTFDKDSPMSPQSAVSYQTNVNRQKTRKWTEAKPVDYGGDDWGDDDDYGPPPPPISKATGLRQQGQGLASSSKADSPVVDNGRKYGDLPPLPGASNPRPRANSFDDDDEQRNFSNSSNQPPLTSNAPATRFSQITGAVTPRNESGPPALSISTQQPSQAPVGLRQTSQISPVPESHHPDALMSGPGRTNTGESSIVSPVSDIKTPSTAGDFHARRDFSPSALPQPLSTRASPAPQSATDITPSQRFPARKSSLSQVSGPPLDEIMGAGSQDTTPKPWIGARPASPGTSTKSPVSPSKALPFIRPADIYRRAEEERRQSIESGGRPSMDSLMGAKASEHSDLSPKPYARGAPGASIERRRASFENEEGSDSGRRLMPMLEPVRERKSEYGFEGFNVDDHGPQLSQPPVQAGSHQNENLDVEDLRRQSTSPKLPDLTRMSGFGMDMFSSKDVEAINKESETTPIAASLSSPVQDLKLREQPSFGFKSVVNQAFDTTDDHSLPDTPASRSASGVNRTDSESTGTGGISPIMSRVSSTAIPETRNRDMSTPAIMEAMEPDSPERTVNYGSRADDFTSQAPGFKPGHRRDISAPSPGNSPARTPDVAISHHLPGSQYAVVDKSSPDVTTPTIEEPLQAPRPFVEREQSFRPQLPGGWTSYATTAQSETSTLPAAVTPVSEAAPSHDDREHDLTPTTTKRSLPPSALGATIAGATLGGAALGRHDHANPSQTPVAEVPEAASSRSLLASSDSTTSPVGHGHPSQTLDASYPPLENASAETQLRPVAVDRPVSSQSTPPPPPPKDTPTNDQLGATSDYFPTVPVTRTPDGLESGESSKSPVRPQVIPTLSTESADYDEENDKLRNEIVRSLTPTPSNATAHTSSAVPDRMDARSLPNANRESSYLPSEYDNYWATTDQEEEVPAISSVHRDVSDARPSTASTGHTGLGLESPIPAPLSPRRPDESLQPPRPALQSRFSWEQSSDDVTAGVNREQGYLATDLSARSPLASELPGSIVPAEEEKQVAPRSPEPEMAGDSADNHGARDAALLAGGAALVGGAAAVTYSDRPEEKSRRLSLAEEKDPRVSSHPVSPTPPEDEHPSRSPQQNFPTSPETYQQSPAPPSTVSPVASIVHPFVPPQPAGRLIAFREIVAMNSPQERIKTFDETRHRFATMDSGLSDWITKLQGQFPDEHGGVTGSWGNSRASMPTGSVRGKFSKAPAGGPAPLLQPPYYQQYLNASSPTSPSTPINGASRPSPSMPTGSQQGLSSAGSKMTTQQVQAKGKELLHTAGIFGGKAGKAGKGLLAKGKNKLRAAGGGDKTSPPAKPKPDRRSSWGLPLSLSRSSTRPDAMSRSSREGTPNSTLGRPRTNTMPTERSSPAPQLPAVATGYSLGVMSGALSSEHPETSRQTLTTEPSSLPASNQIVPPVQDSETRDSLGVPAPIGKSQPSWDPFNATPIAEEDDFQYEGRPNPRLSSDPNSNPDGLSVPADNLAKSDRSNSTDAPFFDAREESEDLNNDWVMVSPQLRAQEPSAATSILNSGSSNDPAPRQSLDKPTTSILNRPRGSFSNDALPQLLSQMKSDADARKSIDGGLTTSILNRPRGSFSYDTPPPTSPNKPMTSPLASPPLFNPTQSAQTTQRAATPPAPIMAAASVPKQRTPSPQKPAQAQPEKQSGASSFLPPIRRTSTFGIGFGSRHPKQRFPIEEDGEISSPRMPSGPQQQQIDEIPRTTSQSGPGPESNHSGAMVGAAVGTAAVAGLIHHENKQTNDEPKRRDSATVGTQRPLSFVQTSAPRTSSQRPPSFPFEQEDLGPADDTNTWGVRDDLPRNAGHPPLPISAGKQRQPSFPPPGSVTDPAPLPGSIGRQRQPSFPPPGFVSDPAPFKDTVTPHQPRPEPVFAEEPEIDHRGDTNTWGVRDELPPNMVYPPLHGASVNQKQASFPPPGFAVDSEAHGPAQGFQPVDSRSASLKKLLTDDTPSSVDEPQSVIPPQVLQIDTQSRGPTNAIREVNPIDEAPPAQARANSREPLPRPLSFQRTPPRESGHQRKPSLPLSFTRGAEDIGPGARNDADEGSTLGADSRRSMSMTQRDPEKDNFNILQEPAQQVPHQLPQKSPQRISNAMFPPPRADAILQNPELNKSQVEWRPNRPKVVPKPAQPSYSSESYGKEIGHSAARTNSWDAQPPPRAYSGSSSYSQRHESQFSEKGGWGSPKPFEQPPSSAQRYPELFKPGQQQSVVDSSREADLPAHYYQAPISRAQAFLPRQQGNEYEIPGVGPPEASAVNPTRRNSGFLRDIGGRLSRTSSRERQNSISRDHDRRSPDRGLESRGEYAESSVMSGDGFDQKKRRASFFGVLNRKSYSDQSPPKSRESVIAHHAGSRTDLLATPQPSPIKRSFFGGASNASEQKSTPKKLQRQSTTGTMDLPAKKKKENRFSTLGGFFGKSSSGAKTSTPVQEYPQTTREVMQDDRQPFESPQSEQRRQSTPNKYQAPDKAQARAESQSRRGVLTKLSASVAPPIEKEKEKERSRSRRPSAAGLLNGFMGRKSNQKERGSDDSRSQGSSQPQVWPQPLLSQTYSDLQDAAPPVQQQRQESEYQRGQDQQQQAQNQHRSQQEMPFQDPSLVVDERRGRRSSREPQYDSVPIPSGYSLVRGQGAVAVPTEYDPRNLNHLQQQQIDPRYIRSRSQGQHLQERQGSRNSFQSQHANIPLQPLSPNQHQQPQTPQYADHPHQQQQGLSHPQPQLGALEAYGDYSNSNRRISHEDILARSPPKPLIDQQRPYQLSLPGGEILDEEDDENTLKNMHTNAPSQIQNQNQAQARNQANSTSSRAGHANPNARLSRGNQDPIIRLQQTQPPTLRHPESPAGYPLPEDTVFSPVNPSAVNFPPPPPPKDGYPSRQTQVYPQHQRHSYDSEDLSVGDEGDLDRSNTRRTAVSAVSARSGGSQHQHHSQSQQSQNGGGTFGGLNVPSQPQADAQTSRNPNLAINTGGRGLSPSPTPPSPMEGEDSNIRRTVVNRQSVDDGDLYDASPRLPPGQGHDFQNSNGNGRASSTTKQYQRDVNHHGGYESQREGERNHRYQEEKIVFAGVGQENGPAELEDHETSMSATSYPGQEWNPYASGAWDDGPDDVGVGPSFR